MSTQDNKYMKIQEYINLTHTVTENHFRKIIFPKMANAYWTSIGESYYPCILLDDNQTEEIVCIVTKSMGIMPYPRKCVFPMNEIEDVSTEDTIQITFC